jgi:hypothetical protein
MNFVRYCVNAAGSTVTCGTPAVAGDFSAAAQAQAWDSFIEQDSYLSKHRGEYAQRGAAYLPFVHRMDFSVSQDVFFKLGGHQHKFQLRADVLNFGNLLNKNWGIGTLFNSNQPLVPQTATAQGVPQYRMRNQGTNLLTEPYRASAGINDVYRIQFGVRYFFN